MTSTTERSRNEAGAAGPAVAAILVMAALIAGVLLVIHHRHAGIQDASSPTHHPVRVVVPIDGASTPAPPSSTPTPSASGARHRHRAGAGTPSSASIIPAPATAAEQASALVAMMHSFDAEDSGPNDWIAQAGDYLAPAARAYFAKTVGHLTGDYYAYWPQVLDDHGAQSAQVQSVEIDPSQQATNTATHLSVLVTYTVTHHGFVYPDPASDPSLSGQSAVLNMVSSDGTWKATYVADGETAPADYGTLSLTK